MVGNMDTLADVPVKIFFFAEPGTRVDGYELRAEQSRAEQKIEPRYNYNAMDTTLTMICFLLFLRGACTILLSN